MRILPLGDSALILEIGESIDEETHSRVQATLEVLEAEPLAGVVELVPAYTTVTVFYDALQAIKAGAPVGDVPGWLGVLLTRRLGKSAPKPSVRRGREVVIPICYDAEFAPDLPEIAQRTGLAPEEVIRRHNTAEYLVYLLGFAPGFPYMGGLPAELSLPRRANPRVRVLPGSVGIVGTQCCIYPYDTPGGWNLLGRTPQKLFHPADIPPAFLHAGDRVRFRTITREEFARLESA